jgi:hypothetical protein
MNTESQDKKGGRTSQKPTITDVSPKKKFAEHPEESDQVKRAVLRAQPTPEQNCASVKAAMWQMGCPE